jgi:hypothetical protein
VTRAAHLVALVLAACGGASTPRGGACPDADPEACHARATAALRRAPGEPAGPAATLAAACARDHAEACVDYGELVARGKVAGVDRATARGFYEKSCALGSSTGCFDVGVQEYRAERYAAAMPWFRKACVGGAWAACQNEAGLTIVGRGVPKDEARGEAMIVALERRLATACDVGNGDACAFLGELALRGTDAAAALARFRRGCELEIGSACTWVAIATARGEGTEVDATAASALLRRGCDLGDGRGCAYLASELEGRGAVGEALAISRRGCDLGSGTACAALASALGRGVGGAVDEAAARGRYAEACYLGFPGGCRAEGMMAQEGLGGPKDPAHARGLFERACAMAAAPPCADSTCMQGIAQACNDAGVAYATGIGGPVDAAKAAASFETGCELGDQDACGNAAPAAAP